MFPQIKTNSYLLPRIDSMTNEMLNFVIEIMFTQRIRKIFITTLISALSGSLFAQDITIYKAAGIYLADTSFSVVEAMAVREGRILATGNYKSLANAFPTAKTVKFKKKYIYPGFIDAHSHFLGYAKGLKECNLVGTSSAEDAVNKLKTFAAGSKRHWLVGRGWDQNDWANKAYPSIDLLDKAFPDRPVYLSRVDGHAAWVNSAAIKELGIDLQKPISGGEILFQDGKFTGILIDNAADLVSSLIPPLEESIKKDAVLQAAQNCYRAGLTSVCDAGIDAADIGFYKGLHLSKSLDLRIYAMLSANQNNLAWVSENGVLKTDRLHVCAVKFYLDGALGSRGALLKSEYCDRPGHKGLLITNPNDLMYQSFFLQNQAYQVCVHAIGDSANKIALSTFSKVIYPGNPVRWRIEHAQITDAADMHYYREHSIIPSVQPTHATSDAPWALDRICAQRAGRAYAFETLRQNAGIVALGTDFPVEDISPLKTFYSAVTRMDTEGKMKEPFLPAQALSRKSALYGMTLWAAIAAFEEAEKGSLEVGKVADFVVTSADLMTVPDNKIPSIKIIATYIDGKSMFKK